MTERRNTTLRDKHRRYLARGRPPCYHCGEPIDYEANHLEPLAYQVDHLIPLAKGGTDTLDNKVPSHRQCNRDKSDKLPDDIGAQFVTERRWW